MTATRAQQRYNLEFDSRLETVATQGCFINIAVNVVVTSCDRIISEPNLDDDDGLLHDVVDLGLDEVEQRADAAFRRLLHLYGAASDGAHGLAHKVHVNLRGVSTNTHNSSLLHIKYSFRISTTFWLLLLCFCSLKTQLISIL